MTSSATIFAKVTDRSAAQGFSSANMAGMAVMGLLWFMLCRHLSNEWSANEQYSYGWFVPFFAGYLFWLRWEDGSKVESRKAKVETEAPISDLRSLTSSSRSPSPLLLSTLAILLFLLLPLRLLEVGNPDWRPLGWVHAAIVVSVSLLAVWRVGGTPWLKHFAFPICFIFVAVPWITPIEEPIVQGLMRAVAAIACEAINLLGIPAQLEGSVIRISSGVVGVNEACSGVRSLQTSLMIGLLFGELKRLSLIRRIALLGAACAIAFIANCGRAFFLVWIAATRNLDAVSQWHDRAGYIILVAVFAGTMALTALFARGRTVESVATTALAPRDPAFAGWFITLSLVWILAVQAGVECWYRYQERGLVSTQGWSVEWPRTNPDFREMKIDETVRSTLRYDAGREASWSSLIEQANPPLPVRCSMFFFRWEPGSTSILRARAHRPDLCLPNTGWRLTGDLGVRLYEIGNGSTLPFRHFSFARTSENRSAFAHAFFCEHEDRVAADAGNRADATAGDLGDWSRSDRLRVVRQGLRNQGQQVLEVVLLTPRQIETSVAQTEFSQLVSKLVK